MLSIKKRGRGMQKHQFLSDIDLNCMSVAMHQISEKTDNTK